MVRRATLGVAVAGTFAFAVPAMASAQTIGVTGSFTAGSDSSATAAISLDTGGAGIGNVDAITTQLGAGLLANLSSATAISCISSSNTSPDSNPACVAGAGSGNSDTIPVTAYLTPPNASLSVTPPGTILAGLDLVTTGLGTVKGDLSIEQLPGGQLVGFLTSDVTTANPLISAGLTQLTLTLNGTLPDGSPLTSMPTACTLATPTQLTVAYADTTEGPTTASPDVSVASTCGTLGYTPTVSGSATTTGAAQGAAVSTVVSQPAGQSNSASTTLSVPGTVLTPNAAAILLANTATSVGTAAITSPLLPVPLTGKAFLTEAGGQLGLSLRFTSPFTFTLNGAVSLTGSVTFANLPDVPIAALAVSLSGGSDALFTAPCAASSGTLSSAFVAQNGAKVSPTSTFTVSGCPATTVVTTPGKPTASGSLTGLSSGHPKLNVKVKHGSNAPNIKSVSVGLPSGLGFRASKVCTGRGSHRKCTSKVKGLSVSGGSVKSAKVSGGRLVITLKSAAGSVSVTVKGPGITETKALKKKVKKNKVKKLTVSVKATNASGSATSISLKLSV